MLFAGAHTIFGIPIYNREPHFFGNPFWDVVRILCVVLAMCLFALIGRVVVEQRHRGGMSVGQRRRFYALGLAGVSVTYTQLVSQGAPFTLLLVINFGILCYAYLGVHDMRREQKSTPPSR